MNVDGVWIPRFKAGMFFCSPTPDIAIIVIEELRKYRQKRSQSAHMLVVLRLLCSEWIRNIYKYADLII